MNTILRESARLGERELILETGRMAKQSNGAVVIRSGDTMVLVTVCSKSNEKSQDFFPLVCDYVEKNYAAGKIPGSYFRREGRQSERETLVSRLIDRPLRPLFPEAFREEVQIIATVLSYDEDHDPDVLSITAASAALMFSDLPWAGPVAALRIAREGGKWIANPSAAQRSASDTDIVMVASQSAIVMVEGETLGLSEEEFLQAMDFGQECLAETLQLQIDMAQAWGKTKRDFVPAERDQALFDAVNAYWDDCGHVMSIAAKLERYAALSELKKRILDELSERFPERQAELSEAFEELKYQRMRHRISREKRRIDGRRLDEVRPITCDVGLLPRVHGSALFTRGETQGLVTLTIGTASDEQRIEELSGMRSKRFMLHYNFPPFSVGEVKPLRSPGRREVGHGMLAERALSAVMPCTHDPEYPHTLRIVSEILESNGSSSMATVCGGTLAAMDAGIPIKAPVAGIAMGLIKEGDDVAILSDILGDEDHLGDMDFKVCGTENKITAIQMDVKISGISRELMAEALEQARQGRKHILSRMHAAIPAVRTKASKYAPRIEHMKIPANKIRDIIGSGGKTIKGITASSGAQINIDDDGSIQIAADSSIAIDKAKQMIQDILKEAKIGEVYQGKVKKIMDFGAFIEIFPGCDGMVHISELTEGHVDNVSDILKEGEDVLVKVLAIDPRGKIKLSRKAALSERAEA